MVVLTSFPPPTEGIKHCEPNTSAHIQTRNLGKGTLYIAESRLSWVGSSGQGFSLEYPSVSLHAVCRDLNAFPSECLYLMIDADLNDSDAGGDSNQDGNDDETRISEIRFVPENKAVLEQMYKAMSACQVLHRDPDDSFSEDEEGCYDDAEDDDEDEGGEYDVQAAEQCGLVNTEGEAEDGFEQGVGNNGEEPMEVGQFDDAEPEH